MISTASSSFSHSLFNLQGIYFAVRHGFSVPNQDGVIVSQPAHGVLPTFGLTDGGRTDTANSFSIWCRENPLAVQKAREGRVSILSSDFSRAGETAILLAGALGLEFWQVQYTAALRERDFGALEMESITNYERVWAVDATNADHREFGVESVSSVLMRGVGLLLEWDQTIKPGTYVFLVSHGDTLQILQTAFAGVPATQHRNLKHLKNAEIRQLNRL